MKRIYQRLKISALPFVNTKKIFFACSMLFLALPSISFSQELIFKDPVLSSGSAGQNNAVYRFPKVSATVDALVKIKGRSASNVIIDNIDVSDFGWTKAFQPRIGLSGGVVSGVQNWWVEFEISFVQTGTSTQVDVNEYDLTALDVDGDGLTIQEYVEFSGFKACSFESGTELTNVQIPPMPDKNYRFTGPVTNYLDIDILATKVMVTCKYEKKNTIKFKIGARSGGATSNAALRYNSIWFRSFSYTNIVFLPVKLTSFTAKGLNNNKVELNWSTSQEKNASHFTIEKSLNGTDFSDAGIIFSLGDSEQPQQYAFTDDLRTGEKGLVYYRLKMVDLDGKSQHSPIKIVRMGEEKANVSILVYPNPVANELRVTLPATWHDKKVTIDIITANGVLVKRMVTNNASQTETINVRALTPGSYLVRSSTDSDSASQRIVKIN